jgi:hypothetical protein
MTQENLFSHQDTPKRIPRIERQFWQFHKDNPIVYELIDRFTKEIIRRGYRNYSIKSVFERVRWHVNIETNDPDFKLNNNHHAYYARLWMECNPNFEGFFRTRTITRDKGFYQ